MAERVCPRCGSTCPPERRNDGDTEVLVCPAPIFGPSAITCGHTTRRPRLQLITP